MRRVPDLISALMFDSLPRRWRRVLNSLAYTGLVALVAALGHLTFQAAGQHRSASDQASQAGEVTSPALIALDGFVTRQARSSDAESLNVSLRLRLTSEGSLPCHVYLVARNDHATPRLWAVWPPQDGGGMFTGGGYLRAGGAPEGDPIDLTPRWVRINATVDRQPGAPPFETVIVYVVAEDGRILLARPFRL
jgi:hypothetical protein